jgi:hypothetical protein
VPAGFHYTRIGALVPSPNPRRHHVVGEVEVDFNAGHSRIVYAVYPRRADALGNFADGLKGLAAQPGIRVAQPAPGLPRPSVVIRASANGVVVSQVSFVADAVGVSIQTLGGPPAARSTAATLSLARFALRHLRAVG